MCELRVFLWMIGLVYYIGHPQPPQLNWAQVYCGCQQGPTRVALHPRRMVEEPERQPYMHWTTCYDYRGDVDYRRVFLHLKRKINLDFFIFSFLPFLFCFFFSTKKFFTFGQVKGNARHTKVFEFVKSILRP